MPDAKAQMIRSLPLAVLKRKTTKAPPLVKSDGAPVERVTLLMLGKNLTFSDGLVLPIQGGQVVH